MDLVVSEMCDHPEENNGVILGDFFFFFFWQEAVVVFLLAMHLINFDILRMLVHNACIPLCSWFVN